MRSELIEPTDSVRLVAVFKDQTGTPADLDFVPTISIRTPSGLESVATSAGVSRDAVGTYGFTYAIGVAGPLGVYQDSWSGVLNGFTVNASFNFVVAQTQMPAIDTDGYYHLGTDVGFHYSQTSIYNINKLLKTLRARLNSSGKSKSKDSYGNVIYVDCDIYSVDMLVSFLANGLSYFNEIPYFTMFTFDDTAIIDQFHDVIVQAATLMALSSQALISRGLEFSITDNGISFQPPTMSELLTTQWSTEFANTFEKIKYIKNSMRPAPMGLGTLRPLASSPAFLRLRHLRSRQII